MMYVSLLILTPVLVCLWIYFLVIVRNSLSGTSIELNIIETKGVVTDTDVKNNSVKGDVAKKKTFHVPRFMLELYEKNKFGGVDKEQPDVVRSLIPTHAGSFIGNEILDDPKDNHLLVFDIPSVDENEKFMSAELKILTLLDFNDQTKSEIRRILKISIYDENSKKLLSFKELQIRQINNTWVSFDVTTPVSDILQARSRSQSLKIVITISSFVTENKDALKLSLLPQEENYEHDYPILILSYSSSEAKGKNTGSDGNTRQKRSFEDDYEEETNRIWDDEINRKFQTKKTKRKNTCKRKPLYIDFSEIKYDVWIVQPSGYDAFQCQGRCFYPVAEHLNPTKHAIVQALLHSVAPSKVSRSCCVPTLLESISILYVDTNGVLTYRYAYKDMVVEECGCR